MTHEMNFDSLSVEVNRNSWFDCMAYRETDRIRARKEEAREGILAAAHRLVAEGGFRSASVAAVADAAGVATGSVYKHFPSKAELFAEVFRRATEKEVAKVAEALSGDGPVLARLRRAIDCFARRAIRGRQLAWALIAEPVDPLVDADRLRYRHAYAEVFEAALCEGMARGELPTQSVSVSAAALVGVMAETLVGPLAPSHRDDAIDHEQLIAEITCFCLQAVTGQRYRSGEPA